MASTNADKTKKIILRSVFIAAAAVAGAFCIGGTPVLTDKIGAEEVLRDQHFTNITLKNTAPPFYKCGVQGGYFLRTGFTATANNKQLTLSEHEVLIPAGQVSGTVCTGGPGDIMRGAKIVIDGGPTISVGAPHAVSQAPKSSRPSSGGTPG